MVDISEADVEAFVDITKDGNQIHKRTGLQIVPGMLYLAKAFPLLQKDESYGQRRIKEVELGFENLLRYPASVESLETRSEDDISLTFRGGGRKLAECKITYSSDLNQALTPKPKVLDKLADLLGCEIDENFMEIAHILCIPGELLRFFKSGYRGEHTGLYLHQNMFFPERLPNEQLDLRLGLMSSERRNYTVATNIYGGDKIFGIGVGKVKVVTEKFLEKIIERMS